MTGPFFSLRCHMELTQLCDDGKLVHGQMH